MPRLCHGGVIARVGASPPRPPLGPHGRRGAWHPPAPHAGRGRLSLRLDGRGRVEVEAYMRVSGREGVWAIGDAAAVPDPNHDGARPCPPTAQHAVRQGAAVAHNIAAELGDILTGAHPGRTAPDEITVFDSLGLAVEDLFAAEYLVERARATGRGQSVMF